LDGGAVAPDWGSRASIRSDFRRLQPGQDQARLSRSVAPPRELGEISSTWRVAPWSHLAFPGAEGYGRFSRGGRGGRVIEVTNLDDSGPGSFRAAVDAGGPRTVVFRVSGVIRLRSPVTVSHPYLTVAGETAPATGSASGATPSARPPGRAT